MIQLEALTLGYGQQILLDHVSANLNGCELPLSDK